ncbi:MAG: LysR family transcriptional regulator [Pseudomonadota bacterium]
MSLAYDWNDLRLFLALVRSGSVRSADDSLGIGRATVSRRIRAFEAAMGTRIFEGETWGLTPVGETLLQTAEQVELQLANMERKLVGKDMRLEGTVRLLAPDFLVGRFLMPVLRQIFTEQPGIDIEVVHTMHLEELTRRDAELAIWLGTTPPEDLIGRRLAPLDMAPYRPCGMDEPAAWVGFGHNLPTDPWIKASMRPEYPRRGSFESVLLQYEAVIHGLGICYLPCVSADLDARLERIPDGAVTETHSLWLLRQADTRDTARLKYVSDRLYGAMSRLAA